jgi:thiamine-phosphate pyrophosphorylase
LLKLDPLCPILPDVSWLARLVPLGLRFVQLRLKDMPPARIEAEIGLAVARCDRHSCTLVVNDYWRDAIRLGASFVHLGQQDLADADLPAIRAAGLKLGISTHSEEELETALRAKPDYVALGPIYETKLKKMPWAPQGLARLGEWRARIACPLVAIGGITLERAHDVFAAGADVVAVVTDIVTNADPALRTRNWLAATSPFRNLSTGFRQT